MPACFQMTLGKSSATWVGSAAPTVPCPQILRHTQYHPTIEKRVGKFTNIRWHSGCWPHTEPSSSICKRGAYCWPTYWQTSQAWGEFHSSSPWPPAPVMAVTWNQTWWLNRTAAGVNGRHVGTNWNKILSYNWGELTIPRKCYPFLRCDDHSYMIFLRILIFHPSPQKNLHF